MVERCYFFHYSNHKHNTWINSQICGGGAFNSKNDTDNITGATTKVGEIWSGSAFYTSRFNKLLSYLSSAGTVDALSSGTIKASDIYTSTYGGKSANTSVIVKFGGIQWIVVYVSQDTSGNPIATLWKANESTTSVLLSGSSDGNAGNTIQYPSNMYSTSYMRVVTLNNGGTYTTSATALTTTSKSSSHTYAKFTMPSVSGSVTNYLVTPSAVSWQENQSAITQGVNDYLLPNEAYGDMGTDTGEGVGWYDEKYNYYSGSGSQISQSDYTAWKDDYLWIPSLTETGYDGSNGLWACAGVMRYNAKESYLRSGFYNNSSYCYMLRQYTYSFGAAGGVARPALHLNLKAASKNLEVLDITSANISFSNSYTYTGSAIKPTVTITYDGTTLTQGTDYTLSYSNNTNVGTATITITGMGDYEGTTTKTFKIVKRSLTKPTLTKSSFEYTGSTITVIENTSSSQDYINNFNYSYETASGTMSATEIGTYTFTIKLKDITNTEWSGDSTDPISFTWSITKMSITIPTLSTTSPIYYTGLTITPSITNPPSADYVTINGDTSAINAGSYTITYALKDTTHYEWSDGTTTAKTLNWLITKKVIPKPTVKAGVSFQYDGTEHEIKPEHLDNWIDGVMVITGGNKFTNVGKYTLQVALTTEGAKNYVWKE